MKEGKPEFKKKVFEALESAQKNYFNSIIYTLILLNMAAIILESMKELRLKYHDYFYWFEVFSIVVFTAEYLLRVWSCTVQKEYSSAVTGRLKFMTTPFAIIDLLSIMPFYLPLLFSFDLRVVRMLRLLRIFRIFKLGRYTKSVDILLKVFRKKKEDLILTVFVITLLLLISSTIMYYCEFESQPDVFSSIPAAMWWGVATLTTVGYGDVYPITLSGKIVGGFISMIGIGVFALPTGILASGIIDEIESRKNKRICPHCKKEINL